MGFRDSGLGFRTIRGTSLGVAIIRIGVPPVWGNYHVVRD